jgi:phosphatidylglycerophosphate synthase
VTLSAATVTTPVNRGPMLGLFVQFVLLVVLGLTVGLSAGGWVLGSAYALVLSFLLAGGLRKAGMTALGPANRITLGRAVLVGGVTALAVTSITREIPLPLLVTLVGVALALDGIDGQVARRTGSTSALGARFDMEIDAFLILVLSVFIAGDFGWWTVAIGAFRYAFVAASWALPWLRRSLPPQFSRKVVAAVQGIVLVVATAHLVPFAAAFVLVVVALLSLTWSFGRDVAWLWRAERVRRAIPVSPAVRSFRVAAQPAAAPAYAASRPSAVNAAPVAAFLPRQRAGRHRLPTPVS